MEIQKIFSDMYGEEHLYSVLMTEDEVALFSELQDRFFANADVNAAADALSAEAFQNAKKTGLIPKNTTYNQFIKKMGGKNAVAKEVKNRNMASAADVLTKQERAMAKAEAQAATARTMNNNVANYVPKNSRESKKIKAAMKTGRVLEHLKKNKMAYGLGTLGVGAATTGAYLLGKKRNA